MDAKKILEKLKEGANFELSYDGLWHGYGAINRFPELTTDNDLTEYYMFVHYPKKKKILESLPWNIVENPRSPKEGEYPIEDGDYITMLDCDEHAVWHNVFHDGHWLIYNKTHVKWWMPITEEIKEYITVKNK